MLLSFFLLFYTHDKPVKLCNFMHPTSEHDGAAKCGCCNFSISSVGPRPTIPMTEVAHSTLRYFVVLDHILGHFYLWYSVYFLKAHFHFLGFIKHTWRTHQTKTSIQHSS